MNRLQKRQGRTDTDDNGKERLRVLLARAAGKWHDAVAVWVRRVADVRQAAWIQGR